MNNSDFNIPFIVHPGTPANRQFEELVTMTRQFSHDVKTVIEESGLPISPEVHYGAHSGRIEGIMFLGPDGKPTKSFLDFVGWRYDSARGYFVPLKRDKEAAALWEKLQACEMPTNRMRTQAFFSIPEGWHAYKVYWAGMSEHTLVDASKVRLVLGNATLVAQGIPCDGLKEIKATEYLSLSQSDWKTAYAEKAQ